jgi:glycosyltransferase involved in cell wall biosynthesis
VRARDVSSILQAHGIEIVHVNLPTVLGLQSFRAGRLLGLPLVAGFHVQARNVIPFDAVPAPHLRRALEKWFSFFYRKSALVISPSLLGKRILQGYGVSRVEVVSNGIDLVRFHPEAATDGDVLRLRATFQLGTDPVVLYVGRLSREKNPFYLLDMMAGYARGVGGRGAVKLLAVGSGELRPLLEKEVKRRGLAGLVRFAGFLSGAQLLAAYKAADLFVLPSRCELQSIVTLEALAMGCAVLIARSSESAAVELVEEGVNGYTFDLDNPLDAAEKMLAIIDASPARRSQMSRASMDLSRTHDSSICAGMVEQLYAGLTHVPAK